MFSTVQMAKLQQEYAKMDKIDVESPTYEKLVNFVDGLNQPTLKVLAAGQIKFLSSLAQNRIKN